MPLRKPPISSPSRRRLKKISYELKKKQTKNKEKKKKKSSPNKKKSLSQKLCLRYDDARAAFEKFRFEQKKQPFVHFSF